MTDFPPRPPSGACRFSFLFFALDFCRMWMTTDDHAGGGSSTRERVIKEIIDTEEDYIRDLEIIIKAHTPWRTTRD